MAKQEATMPMSCYIVPFVTARSMLNPQPVIHIGCSNVRMRRIWWYSFSFDAVSNVKVLRSGLVITRGGAVVISCS
jgi:hypothetical protein